MEIIEALNIVSDFIEGEYQYQDEEGEWWMRAEAKIAMQYLINQGMVQHMMTNQAECIFIDLVSRP